MLPPSLTAESLGANLANGAEPAPLSRGSTGARARSGRSYQRGWYERVEHKIPLGCL